LAKRAHLAEIDRAYQEKRKQNTPWARRSRQFEIDQAALKGAAGEQARKAPFGFPPAAKITPTPPPVQEPEHYEPIPGGGWGIKHKGDVT
jgi:hypothetical protein